MKMTNIFKKKKKKDVELAAKMNAFAEAMAAGVGGKRSVRDEEDDDD